MTVSNGARQQFGGFKTAITSQLFNNGAILVVGFCFSLRINIQLHKSLKIPIWKRSFYFIPVQL